MLIMSDNRVSGTLSHRIRLLSSLEVLNAQRNELEGTLPHELFQLSLVRFCFAPPVPRPIAALMTFAPQRALKPKLES